MPLATIAGHPIERVGLAFRWTSGLAVDADGSPTAYAPPHSGLDARDYLANAGSPGNWFGLICDARGEPVIQGPTDPAPGYYVSPTALADHARAVTDPRRYVDSATVPYVSVPPELRTLGVQLGDVALVEYRAQWSHAIVADVGPHKKIGEGSIALARALGMPSSPKNGGTGAGVRWTVWPGTYGHPAWPLDMAAVAAQVVALRAGLTG